MALAETFEGASPVPFGGESDDVFGEMLDALRAGEVDAVVDDDVAFLALAERSAKRIPGGDQARWLPIAPG